MSSPRWTAGTSALSGHFLRHSRLYRQAVGMTELGMSHYREHHHVRWPKTLVLSFSAGGGLSHPGNESSGNACYIITATIAAPALQQMGVHPLAAILYAFLLRNHVRDRSACCSHELHSLPGLADCKNRSGSPYISPGACSFGTAAPLSFRLQSGPSVSSISFCPSIYSFNGRQQDLLTVLRRDRNDEKGHALLERLLFAFAGIAMSEPAQNHTAFKHSLSSCSRHGTAIRAREGQGWSVGDPEFAFSR